MAAQERLKAPFPYFGGKSRIAAMVWERFGTVQNYVEPFFGSGAVLLGCPHPGHTETVNDADGLLANFWRATSMDAQAVASYADWPVNECVPAGTMIATPSGDVPVESIRPGMLVWGERGGRIVATRVIATKQSQASEFYEIGALCVTGNHPIWTAEHGYQEAQLLTSGMHIAQLNSPVDELDLIMLQYTHERTAVGNLHTDRPAYQPGALCWRDVSRQETIQRAPVARGDWRQNAPRLLDTFAHYAGPASGLSNYRGGIWRRLAGCRAQVDSALPPILRSGQSHRWGRGYTGLHSYAGTAREVVCDARRRALSAGSHSSHEGQTPHARSQGEDRSSRYGPRPLGNVAREAIRSTYGQGAISRAQSQAIGGTSGQAACARTQTEDRRVDHESQAGSVCGDWRDIPLSDRSGAESGCDRSLGQSGDTQGIALQRTSLQVPVAVYNFQTETGNYFANQILVHNCDLHARHRWLVDRRSLVESLLDDPAWYDAQAAGWWVWGISQWIGTGWCPRDTEPSRRVPYLQAQMSAGSPSGQGINAPRFQKPSTQMPMLHGNSGASGRGVHAKKLAHKRPAVAGTGDRTHKGLGVHRASLSQQMPKIGANGAEAESLSSGTMRKEYRENPTALYAYFARLQERLRRVRVCCGDFERILGPSVTWRHGMTAVFLDPPYADDQHAVSYSGGMNVWARACRWCEANGSNPLLRIALCGYAGTWEPPAGWVAIPWKAHGGYGSQGNGRGRENAAREVVWFSPHCLDLNALPLFAALESEAA